MTTPKKIISFFVLIFLSLVLGSILFINLKYYAGTNLQTFDEAVTVYKKSSILTLGLCILIATACASIYIIAERASIQTLIILYTLISFGVLAICVTIVRANPYPPDADQYLIWHMAKYLAGHEGGIPYSYTPNYWIKYPHQASTVVLLSHFIKILHKGDEYYFRLFNAVLYPILCIGIKKSSDLLFRSRGISLVAFLLAALYLPTFFYVDYVYGTVISMTAVVWEIFFFIKFCNAGFMPKKILSLFAYIAISIIGNTFYMTTIIATLAVIAYLLADFIGTVNNKNIVKKLLYKLLCILFISIAIFGGTSAIGDQCQKAFSAKTGIEKSEGMPMTGWILMGISEQNGVNGPGSYTGMPDFLYAENDYDTEKTAKVINERLIQVCKEYLSGKRNLQFFYDKQIIQWTDPWFASLSMTFYPELVEDEKVTDSWNAFLSSNILLTCEQIYSVVLPAIMLMALIGCFALCRNLKDSKNEIYWSLPAFYIIGGFVFQLFWESKSRYCMPYFMVMLPFAAYGCSRIALLLKSHLPNRNI